MINNFQDISLFLKENDDKLTDDNFYFGQIIQRKKDGNEKDSYIVKDLFIKNSEDLLRKEKEIVLTCDAFNARAYLNVNVKSYASCAFELIRKTSTAIEDRVPHVIKSVLSSAAGSVSTRDSCFNKIWVVDYDNGDSVNETYIEEYLINNNIDYFVIPTKNGLHYLVNPFDLRSCPFSDKIQKHNSTLLYIKEGKNE